MNVNWSDVVLTIKSCVLSKKGEMSLNNLISEYFELTGENIPLRKLGCESLEILLNQIPGVTLAKNSSGETFVRVTSQKAGHIADLVRRQKSNPKSRKIKDVTYSPNKQKRSEMRTPLRNRHSFNRNGSRLVQMSSYDDKLTRISKRQPLLRQPCNSRLSVTEIRYNPFGQQSSDESFGDSPRDCRQDLTVTSNGLYRTVSFTGNALRCSVSATPPCNSDLCASEMVDEGICSSWDNGPVMLNFHLVGDDFLLQFAYECLHMDCEWDDLERLSCGMCISGQTIHDFHMQIHHEGLIQSRMVLMLGAVDILQNRTVRSIIDDMTDLLEDIVNSAPQSIVLLTLPFLRDAGVINKKIAAFNEFLKTLGDGRVVHVLDAHPLFNYRNHYQHQTYDNCMNPKCYEGFRRDILCYPHGVVLWSHIGRSYLYNFLLQQLNVLLSVC